MGENAGQNSADDMGRCLERVKNLGMVGMLWYPESEMLSGRYASLDDYSRPSPLSSGRAGTWPGLTI